MEASELQLRQEVVVVVTSRSRADRYAGTIVKIGRKLVTIEYKGSQEVFRIETGQTNDGYGGSRFMTQGQAELEERNSAVRTSLADHGFLPRRHSYDQTLEQLEQVVILLDSFKEGS